LKYTTCFLFDPAWSEFCGQVPDCGKYLPLKLRSQITCPNNSNVYFALTTKYPTHKMQTMSSFTSQS
jgi:hypothetical protein